MKSLRRIRIGAGLRKKVYSRTDGLCTICDSTKNLQIHHINNWPSDNSLKNLVLLCSRCHGKITGLDRRFLKIRKTARWQAELKKIKARKARRQREMRKFINSLYEIKVK